MEEMLLKMNVHNIDTVSLKPYWSTRKRQQSNENLTSEPPLKFIKKSENENELSQIKSPFSDIPVTIPILCDGFKIYYYPSGEEYPPNTVLKMEKSSNDDSTDVVKKEEEESELFLCDVCWRPAHKISLALLHMQLRHPKYYNGYEAMKEKFKSLIDQGV